MTSFGRRDETNISLTLSSSATSQDYLSRSDEWSAREVTEWDRVSRVPQTRLFSFFVFSSSSLGDLLISTAVFICVHTWTTRKHIPRGTAHVFRPDFGQIIVFVASPSMVWRLWCWQQPGWSQHSAAWKTCDAGFRGNETTLGPLVEKVRRTLLGCSLKTFIAQVFEWCLVHFAAAMEQFLGECVVASRETAWNGTCISSNSDPFTDNHNERTQHTTIAFLEIHMEMLRVVERSYSWHGSKSRYYGNKVNRSVTDFFRRANQ